MFDSTAVIYVEKLCCIPRYFVGEACWVGETRGFGSQVDIQARTVSRSSDSCVRALVSTYLNIDSWIRGYSRQ